jgi:hypothetical protein
VGGAASPLPDPAPTRRSLGYCIQVWMLLFLERASSDGDLQAQGPPAAVLRNKLSTRHPCRAERRSGHLIQSGPYPSQWPTWSATSFSLPVTDSLAYGSALRFASRPVTEARLLRSRTSVTAVPTATGRENTVGIHTQEKQRRVTRYAPEKQAGL